MRGNIRELRFGGVIKTYWHRKNRYYKTAEKKVIETVELYSAPTVGGALGHHGELLVLEGFAKKGFLLTGRHTQEYGGRGWSGGDHNLDMIVEKDDQAYGVEVKNTLTYIDREDFDVKIKLCGELGVTPVFAVRMLPTTWFKELVHKAKGFGLIFEWQLYPFGHKAVADEVRATLGLPVDCPASLEEGTMDRFVNWHKGSL
jgi:hypothetical protein